VGAIWFGRGELQERLPQGTEVDVCYRPKIDEWRGSVRVQLQVEDVKVQAQAEAGNE